MDGRETGPQRAGNRVRGAEIVGGNGDPGRKVYCGKSTGGDIDRLKNDIAFLKARLAYVKKGDLLVDGTDPGPGRVDAFGAARNLLHRAADVCLKEGRRLVLVPRETPLSTIHLENMLRLRQAGAMIVPAMPAFYHRPADINALADHFVYRVMDHLGVAHSEATVWRGDVSKVL